jgi:hypothetical protein
MWSYWRMMDRRKLETRVEWVIAISMIVSGLAGITVAGLYFLDGERERDLPVGASIVLLLCTVSLGRLWLDRHQRRAESN